MPSGSCLCKAVKYTFTGAPAMQAICHCHECQKISGSAFTTNLVVPAAAFSITAGTPTSHSTPHATGFTLTVFFCAACGTTLYKTGDSPAFANTAIVQAGTLDVDVGGLEHAKPAAELWVGMRAPWVRAVEGAAQMGGFA